MEHYPGDCVKCRTCTSICPADALELSEEVFAVDMLAGATDRYVMRPIAVKRGDPHTIWHTIADITKTDRYTNDREEFRLFWRTGGTWPMLRSALRILQAQLHILWQILAHLRQAEAHLSTPLRLYYAAICQPAPVL